MMNNNKQILSRVKVNGLYGFADAAGNIVIPCKWKYVERFYGRFAKVRNEEGKWGFIDKTGQEVTPCKWKSVDWFHGGFTRVQNDEGKWGIIDETGQEASGDILTRQVK